MTTKIIFTIPDEIAEQMDKQSPDLFLDVFGGARIRKNGDPYDTELVGQWWRY